MSVKELAQNENPTTSASPGGPDFQLESHDANVASMPGAEAARKAMQAIMDSKTQWSKQHDEINEAFEFYSGDQWSEEDKMYLREENRIPVVFNYIANHIDVIVGSEIQNRQDVRYLPRNLDPQALPQISSLGELETSAADFVLDSCNGYDEITACFRDLLVAGLSCLEIYTDAEIERDIKICVKRIDPMQVMWDGRAEGQNVEDARWIARIRKIPKDEAKEMFPDKKEVIEQIEHYQEGVSLDQRPEKIEEYTPIMYEPGRITTSPGEIQSKKGTIVVIQYQHWVYESMYIFKDPVTGQDEELTKDQYDKLKKRLKDIGAPLDPDDVTKQRRKVYKQQFIAGNQLPLTEDEDLEVQAGGFTFKLTTGKWDQKEHVYRGHLYQLMDPQRYANKYLSQTIHIINSNPKGGVLAEADVFKDPSAVERDWARPNSIILVEKNALAEKRVEVKPVTHLPDATFQMWQHCIESITGVSGVNPEILGMSKGDLPALTMRQRQSAGMQVNAIYFNAQSRFRRNLARTLLEFIRIYIADGRMIRIGGQFNCKMLPLLREKLAPEYNVVIDEALKSPNAKAEVFMALQPILPTIIRAGLVVPELLDLIPSLPASLASKMKEKMGEGPVGGKPQGKGGAAGGGAGKAPEDPQITQGKVAKLQADVQLVQAKLQEVLARARALDANSKTKAMLAQSDMHGKRLKTQAELQALAAKGAREHQQHQTNQVKMFADMMKPPAQPNPARIKEGEQGYPNA
jgi:hypothetical protein